MCKMLQISVLIVILAILNQNVYGDEVNAKFRVVLPHGGVLVGSFMKTVNNKSVRAFRGIPYAEPPVGDLRFKAPKPAKPWTGVKLAVKDGSSCLLQNPYERIFETSGDEDCLFLNVYVPEVKTSDKPFSVMVFLHGGGWITGTGDSQLYGPQRLLDHDVILVSGNYRLGALGFLTTGTEDCPGNNGMKDQVMMLRWVQENIESFGGDPKDVTIFGESAGGASVGYHIYSPLSEGLFHKAILQSGNNLNEWALGDKEMMLERTKKVAKLLECPSDESDWKALIDCLRTKSAKDIASVVKPLFVYDIDPVTLFPVVVEPEHEGAFITKPPKDVLNPPSGNVPIMIGVTSGEGIMRSGPLLNLLKDDFTAKFYDVLPTMLFYDHLPKENQEKITKAIDEFYFKGKHDWSKENHFNLTNMFTDNWVVWGQDKFLRHRFALSRNDSSSPTYVYLYDHRGPISLSEEFQSGPEYYGVCHGDELVYLFFYTKPNLGGDKRDTLMKFAMPYMWTNFAKLGNPTPDASETPTWPSANKFPLDYVQIGRQTIEDWKPLSIEVGFLEDRVQFWRDIEKYYSVFYFNEVNDMI